MLFSRWERALVLNQESELVVIRRVKVGFVDLKKNRVICLFSQPRPAASKSRLCCTYPHMIKYTSVYTWPKTNVPGGPHPGGRIPEHHMNILPVLICCEDCFFLCERKWEFYSVCSQLNSLYCRAWDIDSVTSFLIKDSRMGSYACMRGLGGSPLSFRK